MSVNAERLKGLVHPGLVDKFVVAANRLEVPSTKFIQLVERSGRLALHDGPSANHAFRVAINASIIAEKKGMTAQQVRQALTGGLAHDDGKNHIAQLILQTTGDFPETYKAEMRKHSKYGYYDLLEAGMPDEAYHALVIHRHQAIDPYPTDDEMPKYYYIPPFGELVAPVIAVADTVDAAVERTDQTSVRRTPEAALEKAKIWQSKYPEIIEIAWDAGLFHPHEPVLTA